MTDTQRITFKKNIKKLLIDRDIGYKELAEAAGVSESMISHIINGTKKPPFDAVLSIAERLNVGIDELLKGVVNDEKNSHY